MLGIKNVYIQPLIHPFIPEHGTQSRKLLNIKSGDKRILLLWFLLNDGHKSKKKRTSLLKRI